MRTLKNIEIDVFPVVNNFYGEAITVSGLLTGQDIYEQLKDCQTGDLILLPPRVLNHNNLFLDNWNIEELQTKLKTHCHVYKETLADFIEVIRGY